MTKDSHGGHCSIKVFQFWLSASVCNGNPGPNATKKRTWLSNSFKPTLQFWIIWFTANIYKITKVLNLVFITEFFDGIQCADRRNSIFCGLLNHSYPLSRPQRLLKDCGYFLFHQFDVVILADIVKRNLIFPQYVNNFVIKRMGHIACIQQYHIGA